MTKLALITGASKGIGKELAKVFAQNGYSLILIARTTSELAALQTELKTAYQCDAKVLSVDLSQPNAVDTIMAAYKDDMPMLDVLVNNAGFGAACKFTATPETDVDGMIAVNMGVLTKLTYRVLPYMTAKKSGSILNIASIAAYAPGPYMAEYYATKAYVLSLSEALSEEYAEDGVTVTVVCPGVTRTSFQKRADMEDAPIMKGLLPIMSAEAVAKIAYDAVKNKRRVVITGMVNNLSVLLMRFAPRFLIAKMTAGLALSKEKKGR